MNPIDVPNMMSFCVGRRSAVGPPFIRRSRSAGSCLIRYSVVSAEAPMNTDKYTHACQYRTVPAGTKTSRPITSARTARLIQALAFRFAITTADTIPLRAPASLR